MSAPNREKLVKEIARDLLLREDIVSEVLERFVDLAVEEIVNTGNFKMHRLLSISTVDYKEYTAGKGKVPAQKRLRSRVSNGIHRLFKLKQFEDVDINRDNWKEYLISIADEKKPYTNKSNSQQSSEDFNPLLDEDD